MKHIITILMAAVIAFSASAAETKATVQDLSLFRAGEWQLDLNGTARDESITTDNLSYGGGIGVNYFPWRSAGFGLEAQTEDTSSAFFDKIGVSWIGRMPIEKLRLAPEFRVGYSYDFEKGGSHAAKDPNGHELFASVGAELRLSKHVGFGVEVRGVEPLDGGREYLIGLARVRFNF